MRKKILAVVGVLILGALGNGLWELIRPGLFGGADMVLNIASLGIQSLRDSIYAAAGRFGVSGNAAASDAAQVRGFIAVCTAFVIAAMLMLNIGTNPPTTAQQRKLRGPLILFLALILVTAGSFSAAMSDALASGAARAFELRLQLLAPTISDNARLQFIADFSAVRSEAQYDHVIRSLDDALKAKGIQVPPL